MKPWLLREAEAAVRVAIVYGIAWLVTSFTSMGLTMVELVVFMIVCEVCRQEIKWEHR